MPDAQVYQLEDPEAAREFEDDKARWVNASALTARYIVAGLDEISGSRFWGAGDFIDTALNPECIPEVKKLDCHIMAAAQYILIA